MDKGGYLILLVALCQGFNTRLDALLLLNDVPGLRVYFCFNLNSTEEVGEGNIPQKLKDVLNERLLLLQTIARVDKIDPHLQSH